MADGRRNRAPSQSRMSARISYTVGITSRVSSVEVMTPQADTAGLNQRFTAIHPGFFGPLREVDQQNLRSRF